LGLTLDEPAICQGFLARADNSLFLVQEKVS
jgi:hypothetical protein